MVFSSKIIDTETVVLARARALMTTARLTLQGQARQADTMLLAQILVHQNQAVTHLVLAVILQAQAATHQALAVILRVLGAIHRRQAMILRVLGAIHRRQAMILLTLLGIFQALAAAIKQVENTNLRQRDRYEIILECFFS